MVFYCIEIWIAGHKIAAIPAVLLISRQRETYSDFFTWYFKWLAINADPRTGFWIRNPEWAPPAVQGLGGAFHMFFVYTCAQQQWLYPAAVMNSSFAVQKPEGYWNTFPPTFADLDGIYELTRSSSVIGNQQWAKVQAACDRFLNITSSVLNNKTALWQAYTTTHSLVGAVAAVAECQKWFPDMVFTSVPWQVSVDYGCYI